MNFIGWMYDIAREQSPSEESLLDLIERSAGAGYNALGLYLEHRFAYPSAPWAAGPGCLTPEAAGRLSRAAAGRGVRLIPFLNTLGHMEGFIRSEGGQWLAEAPGKGVLQICPSRPECIKFASNLVADALDAFDDEWVHLGGDETHQLGECSLCAKRAGKAGKEGLYAEFFGRLCRQVLERGRRPCMWGDMLAKYPGALDLIPQETVIFDWDYDDAPGETSAMFRRRGFEVVLSSAVRSYDANWCFLDEIRRLIDAHREEAERLGAAGMLVCAWEFFGFSPFASVLPLIMAAGRRVSSGEAWGAALDAEGGAGHASAAEILGIRIPRTSSFLAAGGWRSLREPLAIQGDPFRLWRAWREDACGSAGDAILRALGEAEEAAGPDSPLEFPLLFHRVCVEWVRLAERAAVRYAAGDAAFGADILAEGGRVLLRLRPGLERIAEGGGSRADPARLDAALEAIGSACARLRQVTEEGGARPAFETLTQAGYLPGDQAAWRTEGPAAGWTARG
ncbi:MAG: family 20 glycosylhydrolase [Nitrospinota bacterium]